MRDKFIVGVEGWSWSKRINVFSLLLTSSLFLLTFFVSGCGGEEKPEPPHPASPESYMNDKEFTGRLAERKTEHRRLVRERNAVVDRMKAMVDAKRAEMKGADDAAVKAELEKDPEWNELHKKCEESNAAIERVRKGMLGDVRERVRREK